MKRYSRPEITVKSFMRENVLTDSTTAVQQATAAAANIADSKKTFTVTW
jgi:hypothetical protein